MAEVTSQVKAAVAVSVPGMSRAQKFVLGSAGALWYVFQFARKVRLVSKKENLVPFAAGSVLQAIVGNNPPLQQVAKFVFGTVSILRCSEDLLELSRLSKLCLRLLRGKEYVYVKGDNFNPDPKGRISPTFSDKLRWMKTVVWTRIKLIFKTLGEIFKRFGQLAWHLGDAYTAFKENTLDEVFIHGKDLWKEITSSESVLVKHLKEAEKVNDFMLDRTGGTKILLRLFLLPAKIQENIPDVRDLKENFFENVEKDAMRLEVAFQQLHQDAYEGLGGDKEDLVDQKYYVYEKGSPQDPNVMRYLEIKRDS